MNIVNKLPLSEALPLLLFLVSRSIFFCQNRSRDELNFPLKENRAPNVRIVGKPHKRGILIYGLVAKTKTRSLPIFVALNIILNPNNRSPMLAMFNILNQWPSNVVRSIIVGDRAFASFNSLTILDRNDWMVIFSLKGSFARSPGFLIATYCCKNGTIAVCNQEGFVISFRRSILKRGCNWCLQMLLKTYD